MRAVDRGRAPAHGPCVVTSSAASERGYMHLAYFLACGCTGNEIPRDPGLGWAIVLV